MSVPIANTAMRIAGPVTAAPVSPMFRMINWRIPFPIRPASLPLASSRNGNLFVDRNDPALHWYLPDFSLAADTDSSFAFSARQTSQQQNGLPFNVGRLVLSVRKSMPADVALFAQTNPPPKLQEIPLGQLTAVLTSPYTDSAGQQQTRTFSSTSVTDTGGGAFQVVFDGSILGDSVVALYQDLRVFGKATVTLSATFQTWSTPGAPASPGVVRMNYLAFSAVPQASVAPRAFAAAPAQPLRPAVAASVVPLPMRAVSATPASPNPPAQPPPPQLVETALPFTKTLPLGLKYNQDGYQLQYTVTTLASPSRVILSVNDLNGFNAAQSQYTELKELGDISARYPSIARAYIGVLSRNIVLIPQRYSIVRGKAGCAATCLARVDTSAASTSQCAFEFTFVVAPEVDRIELAKFQNEVLSRADLNGYEITFASLLRDTPASTLQTTFQSDTAFAAGPDPHTFSVTVSVRDAGVATPAVADANLFILRLCSQTGTDLIGALSLKLDDGFTDPVLATIDLNFAHTAGSSELTAALDTVAGEIHLSNVSPLDLRIEKYALLQGSTLTEVQDSFVLPAQSGRALPLPADNAGISLLAEAELALPVPMTIAAAPNYLNFQTVDVQQTQYLIAIDASGVDFGKVATIAASVTFAGLPAIAPLTFNLRSNLRSDSQHVLIPLVNAMSSLPGTVQLNVSFVDPSVSAIEFSVANDYVAEPVLAIVQSQIAAQLHPAS
jgi:hypothetical protein